MKLRLPGQPHLTYCTNIHPGESWAATLASVQTYVPAVRSAVAPHQKFGVGLRLSARAATELAHGEALPEFKDYLRRHRLYVFTVNGFPYGAFHGGTVKAGVYRPDWASQERLDYTRCLVRILADLLPEGVDGTISTLPVGYTRPTAPDVDAVVKNLLSLMAYLKDVQETCHRKIAIALEPEPLCVLESATDCVQFFHEHLLSRKALGSLADMTGLSTTGAEAWLREHCGVCLDACHMAVQGHAPNAVLEELSGAGLRVCKLQITSALEVPAAAALEGALDWLLDSPYLHQVYAFRDGDIRCAFADLGEAIQHLRNTRAAASHIWRIHAHVPVDLPEFGGVYTTQPWLGELLPRLRQESFAPHLEVETYPWTQLPRLLRRRRLVDSVACELRWTLKQTGA